jgi:hypothetical protein
MSIFNRKVSYLLTIGYFTLNSNGNDVDSTTFEFSFSSLEEAQEWKDSIKQKDEAESKNKYFGFKSLYIGRSIFIHKMIGNEVSAIME